MSFSVRWFGLYVFSTRNITRFLFLKKNTELSVCPDPTGNKSTLPYPSGAVGLVELSVLSQIHFQSRCKVSSSVNLLGCLSEPWLATIHSLSHPVFQFTKSHSASYSNLSLENQGIDFFKLEDIFVACRISATIISYTGKHWTN